MNQIYNFHEWQKNVSEPKTKRETRRTKITTITRRSRVTASPLQVRQHDGSGSGSKISPCRQVSQDDEAALTQTHTCTHKAMSRERMILCQESVNGIRKLCEAWCAYEERKCRGRSAGTRCAGRNGRKQYRKWRFLRPPPGIRNTYPHQRRGLLFLYSLAIHYTRLRTICLHPLIRSVTDDQGPLLHYARQCNQIIYIDYRDICCSFMFYFTSSNLFAHIFFFFNLQIFTTNKLETCFN